LNTGKMTETEFALTRLSLADLQRVRDWLDDFIEDQFDVSDEFKAKIEATLFRLCQ